jgi:hypothetical protein
MLFGGLGVLLILVGGAIGLSPGAEAEALGGNLVMVIGGYVVGILASGLVGGIVGAIYALIYNLVAAIAGGIKIEIR